MNLPGGRLTSSWGSICSHPSSWMHPTAIPFHPLQSTPTCRSKSKASTLMQAPAMRQWLLLDFLTLILICPCLVVAISLLFLQQTQLQCFNKIAALKQKLTIVSSIASIVVTVSMKSICETKTNGDLLTLLFLLVFLCNVSCCLNQQNFVNSSPKNLKRSMITQAGNKISSTDTFKKLKILWCVFCLFFLHVLQTTHCAPSEKLTGLPCCKTTQKFNF